MFLIQIHQKLLLNIGYAHWPTALPPPPLNPQNVDRSHVFVTPPLHRINWVINVGSIPCNDILKTFNLVTSPVSHFLAADKVKKNNLDLYCTIEYPGH